MPALSNKTGLQLAAAASPRSINKPRASPPSREAEQDDVDLAAARARALSEVAITVYRARRGVYVHKAHFAAIMIFEIPLSVSGVRF